MFPGGYGGMFNDSGGGPNKRRGFGGGPPGCSPFGDEMFVPNQRVDIDLMPNGYFDPNGKLGVGFPDTPDFEEYHRKPQHVEERSDERLRDFAPPGSLPPIGSKNSPNFGLDGKGDIIMKGKAPNKPVIGDYEQMQRMGMIPPPGPGEPKFDGPGGFGII